MRNTLDKSFMGANQNTHFKFNNIFLEFAPCIR